ncbi:hypothetical protein B296_00057496 [Ensete ventricosum]|uniref:Uncharacterized protein n=1 Tax=Ensete ventricosum TaxID=4639 RepID=A0A426X6X0_ENSVE|nr:hypothetical protein B296_00057496 [Ensete ventricosum]
MFVQSHVQTRVSIGFSCTFSEIQNTGDSQCISPWEVVRAWYREKCDGHKHCTMSLAKSSFDRFFMYHLRNSKYRPFPTYKPMGSHTSIVS